MGVIEQDSHLMDEVVVPFSASVDLARGKQYDESRS